MTGHGRHRKRHVFGPIAAAAATIAVLVGVGWAIDVSGGGPGPVHHATTRTTSVQASVARATTDCRAASDLFTADLVAMNGAIQQWRLHIDAMTQLDTGRIDLAQATAFWDSTRVEGKRSLALWERVDGRYRSERSRHCAAPEGAGDTAAGLQSCQERQRGADAVLKEARQTLADWKRHIKDMDALRAGTLDPGHALHMWHRMYQRGKAALHRYDAAHDRLDRLATCSL